MISKIDAIDSVICFQSIGVFVTDEKFSIEDMNDTVLKQYSRGQLEEIVTTYLDSSNYFCVLDMQCEVEVVKQGRSYVFLIQSKQEFSQLCKKLGKLALYDDEVKHILNSSFDGIAITDADGMILYENPAFEQFTGMRVQELIGQNVKNLVNQGIVDHSITIKILKEKKPASIIQTYSATGKKVFITGVPIKDQQGKIKKIVINTRDLTILNKLEKEIQDLKLKNQKIQLKNEELSMSREKSKSLVGYDLKMKKVIDRSLRVAEIDSTVLIHGESGVGKEEIVNLIHQNSNRKNKPLVKINCGAIPEHLLESELFGYEAGAFSGANQKGKPGLFETASGGTILLDEVGELPLQLQVKLLRVLQEYEITRIGGIKPIKIDVRIITATNRNLDEMVAKGEFREDLFYRLKIIPIQIPPLRERKEDVIPLIYHFLNQIRLKYGINRMFSQEALESLKNYPWPGNVRELQNLVERVSLMVNKTLIDISDIHLELDNGMLQKEGKAKNNEREEEKQECKPLKLQMEEYEKEIIYHTLSQFSSMRRAAKALGIDQSTLVRKKQKYQL